MVALTVRTRAYDAPDDTTLGPLVKALPGFQTVFAGDCTSLWSSSAKPLRGVQRLLVSHHDPLPDESVVEPRLRSGDADAELFCTLVGCQTVPVDRYQHFLLDGSECPEAAFSLFMHNSGLDRGRHSIKGIDAAPETRFPVAHPARLGCPNPIDGASMRDREHPRYRTCHLRVIPISQLPRLKKSPMGDFLLLIDIGEDALDRAIHPSTRVRIDLENAVWSPAATRQSRSSADGDLVAMEVSAVMGAPVSRGRRGWSGWTGTSPSCAGLRLERGNFSGELPWRENWS